MLKNIFFFERGEGGRGGQVRIRWFKIYIDIACEKVTFCIIIIVACCLVVINYRVNNMDC